MFHTKTLNYDIKILREHNLILLEHLTPGFLRGFFEVYFMISIHLEHETWNLLWLHKGVL